MPGPGEGTPPSPQKPQEPSVLPPPTDIIIKTPEQLKKEDAIKRTIKKIKGL